MTPRCLCVLSQIMKEWAEADNQSKNLPKSDRQALNEVGQAWIWPHIKLFKLDQSRDENMLEENEMWTIHQPNLSKKLWVG